MPTKQELEQLPLTLLAQKCRKIAEDPSIAGEKARQMNNEWGLLIAQQPHPVLAEQQKIETQMESLKKRMVEFLAATL